MCIMFCVKPIGFNEYVLFSGAQCLPQRAALFKSVLNFLKKAISDQAFGEQVRHMMDGTLPTSLKHIIGNVEYYGPALFLLGKNTNCEYVRDECLVCVDYDFVWVDYYFVYSNI